MSEEYRYEIKFILNESELAEAYVFLKFIGAFEAFPDRTINSLYFDTTDFKSVRDNLAGISKRDKVRLRWYDENESEVTKPVLEIKKRNGRLGSKDKYDIQNISINDILTKDVNGICKDAIHYIHTNYEYNDLLNAYYMPVLYVNYVREYYENISGLRITIDKKINFRNISFNNPINYYSPISYTHYIMELKFPIEMKNEVAEIIRFLNFTPKRHSKYLTGMSKLGYAVYI